MLTPVSYATGNTVFMGAQAPMAPMLPTSLHLFSLPLSRFTINTQVLSFKHFHMYNYRGFTHESIVAYIPKALITIQVQIFWVRNFHGLAIFRIFMVLFLKINCFSLREPILTIVIFEDENFMDNQATTKSVKIMSLENLCSYSSSRC